MVVIFLLLQIQVLIARNLSPSLSDTQTGQGEQDQSCYALSSVAQLNGLTSLNVYASRLPHSQPTDVH